MKKRVGATIEKPQNEAQITFDDGTVFMLAAPIADLLRSTLTTNPEPDYEPEVTTGEAAAYLNVSRTTITKMIDAGRLPARLVGTHRRVRLADVLAAREVEIARRTAALDDLLENSERHQLYETSHKRPLR